MRQIADAVRCRRRGRRFAQRCARRCVWEVVLGKVDLCVGDFWETTERRQLSTMTASLDIDVFSLVANSDTLPKTVEYFFAAIFLPFDNYVWML